MKRRFLLFSLVGVVALAAALVTVVPAGASSFTVSPWAYACGHTNTGNPATATADCDGSSGGVATSSYTAGALTLSKNGPTTDDLSSGATIGGLVTLTAASWDITGYCGAGAPRLNVVTSDGEVHFFGCAANNSGGHVSLDLSAAGDGNNKGGVLGKSVTDIEIVQDESTCNPTGDCTDGPAILTNLSFTGATNAPSPSPCVTPSPSQAPSPSPTPSASAARVTTLSFVQSACPTARPTPKPPTTGVGYDSNGQLPLMVALFVLAVVAINGGLFLLARRK